MPSDESTPQGAAEYYEHRYRSGHGYMDEWPEEKKERVSQVIKELELPGEGRALDFGCGTGVFTALFKRALPQWTIWGTDISTTALANAARRCPDCTFVELADPRLQDLNFDLLFTHHVLEHVHDLETTWEQIGDLAAERATLVHVLPCGNRGSLEYEICDLREGGIEVEAGNRFFYEDEGHLRRLTTEEVCLAAEPHGFALATEYYLNQYYGSLRWIYRTYPSYILTLLDPTKTRGGAARRRVRILRFMMLALWLGDKFNAIWADRSRRRPRDLPLKALALPFLVLKPLYRWLDRRAEREWKRRRHDRGGSEMILHFTRP